jgi:hypothetical protein
MRGVTLFRRACIRPVWGCAAEPSVRTRPFGICLKSVVRPPRIVPGMQGLSAHATYSLSAVMPSVEVQDKSTAFCNSQQTQKAILRSSQQHPRWELRRSLVPTIQIECDYRLGRAGADCCFVERNVQKQEGEHHSLDQLGCASGGVLVAPAKRGGCRRYPVLTGDDSAPFRCNSDVQGVRFRRLSGTRALQRDDSSAGTEDR